MIVAEDLAVANLIRRKPGAGRGGRGLNRALADAAPAELRRQLSYKTTWYGSALLVADRYPSSKTCSAYGWRKPNLPLAERTWTCDGCGAEHDRENESQHSLNDDRARHGFTPIRDAGVLYAPTLPSMFDHTAYSHS